MIKKFYELSPWEKAKHWDEILTFIKIDGMYAHWENEKWKLKVGQSYEYENSVDDPIYYPLTKTIWT